MKTEMKILVVAILCMIISLSVDAQSEKQDLTKNQVKVEVNGLSCPFCAYGLEKKLKKIEGISNLKIDIEIGQATFDLAKGKDLANDDLKKIITDAGFTPGKITYNKIPKINN